MNDNVNDLAADFRVNDMPICYAEHPVSTDQKRQLRAKGFQVVDKMYVPESMRDGDKVLNKTKVEKKEDAAVRAHNPDAPRVE